MRFVIAAALRPALVLTMGLPFVFALATGCHHDKEPEKNPAFNPTSDAAPHAVVVAADAAASANAITPAQRRDWHIRLHNELCENAAKHANVVNGRKDTDPVGINLLSTCLNYGNAAWYKCMLPATKPEEIIRCNDRFLGPPED